ncbi:MAG: hypothetical protein NC293_08765, partial [Roseburia sp.]|nr:hypothetical protein [Roseburia sp.]
EEGGAERMCEILESEWRAGVEEGHQKGLEDGRVFHLISLTLKKRDRGMMIADIADALEEDDEMIERILLAADKAGSDEVEKIYDWL